MKKHKRLDVRVRLVLDAIGATLTLVGLGGLAGASEGQGNFTVALFIFALGAIEVMWSYTR